MERLKERERRLLPSFKNRLRFLTKEVVHSSSPMMKSKRAVAFLNGLSDGL